MRREPPEASFAGPPAAAARRACQRHARSLRFAQATSPSTNPCHPGRAPAPFCPQNSPQLQCGETEQHEHHGDDPEANDHLRLLPSRQLVVMVKRRHSENALAAAPFEVQDLIITETVSATNTPPMMKSTIS